MASRASAAASAVAPLWIRTESDRRAIAAGCDFDPAAAERPIRFIETFLRHSIGSFAAKPFILEPWQKDFLRRLYGWKRRDGSRRFREAYLEVSKKNGKSTLLAGIALYAIFEERGGEVYLGAYNRKQARIIFNESARMIASSPDLRRHLRVIDSTARITFPQGNSKIEAMSADSEGADGANASTVVLDEVHRYKNRRLYDVMKYSGAARRQPLLISITTAGSDKHSICYQLHQRARAILDGTVADDVDFLPVIYAADPDRDDLDDPRVWHKANPSLGVILSVEDFRSEWEQAKRIPGQRNNFLRLRFGIWTDAASRWLPADLWDAGLDPLDPAELEQATCYAALDLSSVRDLTSLSLVFPRGEDYYTLNYCWIPEDTAAERSEADGVPYLEWVDAGRIIATPGNATDHDAIRAHLVELRKRFDIRAVGVDPWNAQALSNDLLDDEFHVVEIRQGFPTLTGPSKELERLLLAGRFRHDGNPCLRWAILNCATETDPAGNIKPSKRRSTERIDPAVATIMALGLAHGDRPAPTPRISIISRD